MQKQVSNILTLNWDQMWCLMSIYMHIYQNHWTPTRVITYVHMWSILTTTYVTLARSYQNFIVNLLSNVSKNEIFCQMVSNIYKARDYVLCRNPVPISKNTLAFWWTGPYIVIHDQQGNNVTSWSLANFFVFILYTVKLKAFWVS